MIGRGATQIGMLFAAVAALAAKGLLAHQQSRQWEQVGPGKRSVLTIHREIRENRAHNEQRARRGRYNWNNH